MEVIIAVLGVAILFNFVILRIKWNRGQYIDAGVDVGMLLLLNMIFGGSMIGAASATAGSTLISLYLMKEPIRVVANKIDTNKLLSNIADKIDDLLK